MCWGGYGRIDYWPCGNFLEMAQVISNARAFIGNQSFPMAMALAMGKTVLQEVFPNAPDCLFPKRKNLHTELKGFNP